MGEFFALFGAILGYVIYRASGWLGAGIGAVLGMLIGVIVYNLLKRKTWAGPGSRAGGRSKTNPNIHIPNSD